jgi:hypothetical protein
VAVYIRDKLHYKNYTDNNKKISEALPLFVFNKNCSKGSFDKNKFLLPDIYIAK